MRALTLWQPWAWAIAAGHKRIENRPWKLPAWAVGEWLGLHAGKVVDKDGQAFLTSCGLAVPCGLPRGAVVALVRFGQPVRESTDPMFFGPWGWPVVGVRQLVEPIPCAGALSLWRLPPDVEAKAIQTARAEVSA